MSDSLRVTLVQFNPIVGDLDGNAKRIVDIYNEHRLSCDLVIFPEMAVTGYPIEDLALLVSFQNEVKRVNTEILESVLSEVTSKNEKAAGILFGTLNVFYSTMARNVAILYDPMENVQRTVIKHELPNYGVFDEKRIFEPSLLEELRPVPFRGNKLGVMICEDFWFPAVTRELVSKGAECLIVLNGSPYEIGKSNTRFNVAQNRLTETQVNVLVDNDNGWSHKPPTTRVAKLPLIYLNLVGGQDELVFDGNSFTFSDGRMAKLPSFQEEIQTIDFAMGYSTNTISYHIDENIPNHVYRACVLGLRDYMRKSGFKSAVIGMSGGVDSGIVAAIACDAIGPESVELVRLPSKFSSDGSLVDAETAAKKLGANMRTIEIEGVVDALRAAYVGAVSDNVKWPPLKGVADENIQARARGNILMSISNQEGHILLTTGNRSENYCGFTSIYGDMCGGFNPLKDCYKTMVWALCRWRNTLDAEDLEHYGFMGRVGDMVPEEIIVKPPSAELKADQKDSDSLPDYQVLDAILNSLIEEQHSIVETAAILKIDIDIVEHIENLINRAEYKRRQAAPGIKLTSKLHGRERRVPIVNYFHG
jgi:NAD+ synthase